MLDSPENSRCPSPTLSAKDRTLSSSSLSGLMMTSGAALPPAVGCVPDEATKQIMTQTFLNYGRASNLFRIMAFFPSFWEKFEQSQSCMMNGPGPIPKPWRCYVAIMVSALQLSSLPPHTLTHLGVTKKEKKEADLATQQHHTRTSERLGQFKCLSLRRP